ncbi:GPI-linked NAD(P)(+)--arginine ADP-ribosyltransferase 1 isoform X2 [Hyperolius riggenbachi]
MVSGSSGVHSSILVCAVTLVLLVQVDGRRTSKRDVFSPKEFSLDMARSSFDDQYKGCSDVMEEEVEHLLKAELSMNKELADAWKTAEFKWEHEKKRQVTLLKGFKDKYAIALLAYTINGPLHKVFNEAVRDAGQSKQYYLKNFNFKALHYYLTKAVQVIDSVETPACHNVFRGTRGVRFRAVNRSPIRFGQFTSSSMNDQNALQFGEDTFFSINTCYGVSIRNFSFFPGEDEVLIPPYEKFKVTNFTKDGSRNVITLQSLEKSSVYNCELAKERRCKSRWCPFSAATRTRMQNPQEVTLMSSLLLFLSHLLGPGSLCT